MNSHATKKFWDRFHRLPHEVQLIAVKQYRLWKENPDHRSLNFKKLSNDYWSARVTEDYRAIGVVDSGTIVWFFIGTHAEYDRLLKNR